jgi:hypothetical protein
MNPGFNRSGVNSATVEVAFHSSLAEPLADPRVFGKKKCLTGVIHRGIAMQAAVGVTGSPSLGSIGSIRRHKFDCVDIILGMGPPRPSVNRTYISDPLSSSMNPRQQRLPFCYGVFPGKPRLTLFPEHQ